LPFRWERALHDREDATVDIDLQPETGKSKVGTPPWMLFTAGGVAVGALATGAILAIHANDRSNDETAKNPFLRDPNEKSSIQTESTVANVFFVAGAVFAVGTAALVFTTDWKKKEKEPQPASSSARLRVRVRSTLGGIAGEF